MSTANVNPPATCDLCPRLKAFRDDLNWQYPDWHNAPVNSFGSPQARLLIVGLAPGMKGANRTGRPFTGDYAGDLLYATMIKFGFARGHYQASPDDGLELDGAMITNAVRCLPPQNKPTGEEIRTCRPFLLAQIDALPRLGAILALGRIAHDSVLTTFGLVRARHAFGHGVAHDIGHNFRLYDSYHCSRYNTNTGRLTTDMFERVFAAIRADIGE
jgi:uracil-DNA glycosylase family 4